MASYRGGGITLGCIPTALYKDRVSMIVFWQALMYYLSTSVLLLGRTVAPVQVLAGMMDLLGIETGAHFDIDSQAELELVYVAIAGEGEFLLLDNRKNLKTLFQTQSTGSWRYFSNIRIDRPTCSFLGPAGVCR